MLAHELGIKTQASTARAVLEDYPNQLPFMRNELLVCRESEPQVMQMVNRPTPFQLEKFVASNNIWLITDANQLKPDFVWFCRLHRDASSLVFGATSPARLLGNLAVKNNHYAQVLMTGTPAGILVSYNLTTLKSFCQE